MSEIQVTDQEMDTIESKEEKKRLAQKGYFKHCYYSNPEYKEKHLKKMREKVLCEICNVKIARSTMTNHKRTNKHKLSMEIFKLKSQV